MRSRWWQVGLLGALQLAGLALSVGFAEAVASPQASEAFLAGYLPLNGARLAELSDRDPKLLVIKAFDHGDRPYSEGIRQERILVTDHGQRAEVLMETIGLMDDSVRGVRYRSQLELKGETWRFVRAGVQIICQPGRGHQDWSAASCQ